MTLSDSNSKFVRHHCERTTIPIEYSESPLENSSENLFRNLIDITYIPSSENSYENLSEISPENSSESSFGNVSENSYEITSENVTLIFK